MGNIIDCQKVWWNLCKVQVTTQMQLAVSSNDLVKVPIAVQKSRDDKAI